MKHNFVKSLAATAAAGLMAMVPQAQATFIIDSDPGGLALFLNNNKAVSSFTGNTGANNSGLEVKIDTTGSVDSAGGNALIKPVKDMTLTQLWFTPEDPDLFGSFSFRGRLDEAAMGTVTLTVQDNQGNDPQIFIFTGLGDKSDFDRIGIISIDEQTIKSIRLDSVFLDQKQSEFGFANDVVRVPEGGATVALLGLALSGLGAARRFSSKKA